MEDVIRNLQTCYKSRINREIETIYNTATSVDLKSLFYQSLEEGYAGFVWQKDPVLSFASRDQLIQILGTLEGRLCAQRLTKVVQIVYLERPSRILILPHRTILSRVFDKDQPLQYKDSEQSMFYWGKSAT